MNVKNLNAMVIAALIGFLVAGCSKSAPKQKTAPDEKIRAPLAPLVGKKATLQDFVGEWSGHWDDTWAVHFTITENPTNSSSLRVLYQWEENLGEPLSEERYAAFLTNGALNIGSFIEIIQSPNHPNRATAVGHFKHARTANLILEETETRSTNNPQQN
jgi:hypothetical protein